MCAFNGWAGMVSSSWAIAAQVTQATRARAANMLSAENLCFIGALLLRVIDYVDWECGQIGLSES
jgi:hypothetical protein